MIELIVGSFITVVTTITLYLLKILLEQNEEAHKSFDQKISFIENKMDSISVDEIKNVISELDRNIESYKKMQSYDIKTDIEHIRKMIISISEKINTLDKDYHAEVQELKEKAYQFRRDLDVMFRILKAFKEALINIKKKQS